MLTGITLTAGGIAIILGIRIRIIALLLALKTFIWVFLVHVPSTWSKALAADRGNLLASTFVSGRSDWKSRCTAKDEPHSVEPVFF
ncbi:hypothetical protein SNE25_16085 [Mucilaginibacter sabulilitoris]|uniref:Uncharacterized protein n=1 Tax=Mucilaginibacter sabulilitoris TaxID=1173583 RepID=A0ABZ0TX01_9SPHI|nr:hypothetical protein [Mucilaginibacter sabulilitoris]WPU97042.1 hypothetical protein SNE25_16085 [Mucilaginibacter sabulilitoris]